MLSDIGFNLNTDVKKSILKFQNGIYIL